MILDKGIATIYHKINTASPGGKPTFENVAYWQSWYGELNFETSPSRPTESREEIRNDARVRILQNRRINNHDRVELAETTGSILVYEVTRAWHGMDEESGEQITDLTLEVIEP